MTHIKIEITFIEINEIDENGRNRSTASRYYFDNPKHTMFLRQTLVCLRRARVTIPQLSPTHSQARIMEFCVDDNKLQNGPYLECYDPLFVLECSPDLVTEGYRKHPDHCPHMIVESQEEGIFRLKSDIEINTWYPVGHVVGEIDDGDDDGDNDEEWLWQAYNHDENQGEEDEK